MIKKPHPLVVWRVLAIGLVAIPLVTHAQNLPTDPAGDWRSINDTVGQFKRGHADVLKWEQANLPADTTPTPVTSDLVLLTAEDAVRQVWRAHQELAHPQARLGADIVKRIADGRWNEVDPGLQRRVDDMSELMEVAIDARKTWLQAVAARQVLKSQRDALEAAEAANELGQRMVRAGNWSKLQQTQVQLARSSAQMNLLRANYAAAQAQANLLKILRLTGLHATVGLPEQLPELPQQLMSSAEWQQRLIALQAQSPRAESMRNRANAKLGYEAYQSSHAIAKGTRDEVLKVREFITEETTLRYNGMLKSVWDLLTEVRNQSQADIDAVNAQRDFWIAETDLQWTLQGGAPTTFVTLGAGGNEAATAGH